MIKLNLVAFCMATVLLLLACKKEDESVLKGCCGNPAIDEAVGNGHLYVPNIFTPDGDGINDHLHVIGDSRILIVDFEVRDRDGNLVFDSGEIVPGNPNDGWDGTVNGEVKKGLYDIRLYAEAEDGTTKVIENKVCNYPCNDIEVSEYISPSNCYFPSQVMDGHYNSTIPSGEAQDCFE